MRRRTSWRNRAQHRDGSSAELLTCMLTATSSSVSTGNPNEQCVPNRVHEQSVRSVAKDVDALLERMNSEDLFHTRDVQSGTIDTLAVCMHASADADASQSLHVQHPVGILVTLYVNAADDR
eukprot:m.1122523 g.1122523  ORF g.1122523 m.1122523 type:complete len:122 (+) comp24402_c0_seq26:96-461(+)